MQNTNQEKSKQISRWHDFETQDAINHATLNRILAAADEAIATRGHFSIVLAGGATPKSVYALLKEANADWAHWHIYHNDDRCLPKDNAERNSLMARTTWLNHVSIPANQIHDIPAELGNIDGAKAYAKTLHGLLAFDLVLLGLGEDGHTASLFPGHVHDLEQLTHAVYNSPKPPPERVSISAKALSDTKELLFLITGANKQEAVKAWRAGADLPVATIIPQNSVDIYIDADADNNGL